VSSGAHVELRRLLRFATHSSVKANNAGLDQQMPDASLFNTMLLKPSARIDDAVVRILTTMINLDLINNPPTGNVTTPVRTPAHRAVAKQLAIDGTVLLKNDFNILPLNMTGVASVVMIGDDCNANDASGGGSGYVCCDPAVSPFEAMTARVPKGVMVTYIPTHSFWLWPTAAAYDLAIVCVASFSSEGMDRASLRLSSLDEFMIEGVGTVQKNTVVVMHTTGNVNVQPWINYAPALIGEVDGVLCF
jgi:beta-glucosidase